MSLCAVAQPAATPPMSAGPKAARRLIQCERFLSLLRKCRLVLSGAEQCVMRGERGLDLGIGR
jgi:hypothetical protein